MWEEVQPDDRTTLLRCAAIIGQMKVGYDHVNIARVQSAMSFNGLRVYFYREDTFQLVMCVRLNPIVRQWDIFGMGFFGAGPDQSAQTMALFVRSFIEDVEASSLHMLCPHSPVFGPFADALKTQPDLRILVRSASEIGESWTIEMSPTP